MESPICCKFHCRWVELGSGARDSAEQPARPAAQRLRFTDGRALPSPHSRALERVRSSGRRLLRELPHVLRRGDDRAVARGGRSVR